MAGFQENLTDVSAPAVGTIGGGGGGSVSVPSTAQSLGSAFAGIAGTIAQAMPAFEKMAVESQTNDLVSRRHKLDAMIQQDPNRRTEFATKLKSWELDVEKAVPTVGASVKQTLGIKDLNISEERARVEADTLLFEQTGKAYYENSQMPVPSGVDVLETGRDIVLSRRKAALALQRLETELKLDETQDKVLVNRYSDVFSAEVTEVHGSLIRGYQTIISQIDPATTKGQETLGMLSTDLMQFRQTEAAQIRANMNAKGIMDNTVIEGVINNSLKGVDSDIKSMRDGNKYEQEFAIAKYNAKETELKTKLLNSDNIGIQISTLAGNEGLATAAAAMRSSTPLTAWKKAFGDSITGASGISSRSAVIVNDVFESGKETATIPPFKTGEDRLAYVEGVAEHAKSFYKYDGVNTQDKASTYGNVTSKLLETVTGLQKFENMSHFLKSTRTDEHKAAMSKLPPSSQQALKAKMGGVALDVGRKTVQTVGTVPGMYIYNSQTGRFTLDTSKSGEAIAGRNASVTGPTIVGSLLATQFTGEEETTKAEEWSRAPAAVKTLNEMADMFRESTRDDPRLKGLSDVEINYLFAESLGTATSSINITSAIDLSGKLAKVDVGGESVTLDQALSKLAAETDQAIQSNIGTTQQPQQEQGPVGDTITPAPNPADVEVVPLIEDMPIEIIDGRPEGMTDTQIGELVQEQRIQKLLGDVKDAGITEQNFKKEVKKSFGNMSDDWGTQLFDWVSNTFNKTEERVQEAKKPVLQESEVFVEAAKERGLNIDQSQLKFLSAVIEQAESGGQGNPQTVKNPTTSATGYFQIINDQRRTSAQSIINRLGDKAPEWVKSAVKPMSEKEHVAYIGSLSREQQEALFMARLFETNGSDKKLKAWIESGYAPEKAADLYMTIHHTQPSTKLKGHFMIAARQVSKVYDGESLESKFNRYIAEAGK